MIRCLCPHCNDQLSGPNKNAGSIGHCPTCGKAFTWPAPVASPPPPPTPDPFDFPAEEPSEPPRRKRQPGSDWPLSARVLVWLLLVLILSGIIVGGFVTHYYTVVRPWELHCQGLWRMEASEHAQAVFVRHCLDTADTPGLMQQAQEDKARLLRDWNRLVAEMKAAGITPIRPLDLGP